MVFFFQHYVLYRENNRLIAEGKIQFHEIIKYVSKDAEIIMGRKNSTELNIALSHLYEEAKSVDSDKPSYSKFNKTGSMKALHDLEQIKNDFIKKNFMEQKMETEMTQIR